MDVRSAELTKYAANAMLATKISFMNEISTLAEVLGADIEQVRQGIGSDPRIGYDFIYPGCGYGGSCFPKDVMALLRTGQSAGIPMPLIDAVDRVNTNQKRKLFEKLNYALNGELQGKTIAVWGLSFKPDTDDMREAPSRTLMEELWNHGVTVQAYDPVAVHEAKRIYGLRADLKLMATANDALMNADALVICTEWKEFRAVDFAEIKKRLSAPIIVDGRNLFQPSTLSVHGLRYFSIGRSNPL